MTFDDLNLLPALLKALHTAGYERPTPIQQQAIPHVLDARDLLGVAQTGTGKTAAFTLPLLQRLHEAKPTNQPTGPRAVRALILTPTRELAIQIGESFETYGQNLKLRHAVIFGGVSQHPQVQALQRGVDALIATPGRLLDLINQGYVNLKHLEIFVLDEADRMLDMGFINDIRKILPLLPKQRQSLFFSATMPPTIQQLADTILRNPVQVAVTPVSSTAETVEQAVYMVEKTDKPYLLLEVLKNPELRRVLVFSRTKHGADRVAKGLTAKGIGAEAIHGNKSQNARQRALQNFKSGETRVLVATDLAARGLDVDELSHVINYELPNEPETYVHRIGRTGRAGAAGVALSFCDLEERAYLQDIQRLINREIPVEDSHSYANNDVAPVPLKGPNITKPKGPAGRPPRAPRGAGAPGGSAAGSRREHTRPAPAAPRTAPAERRSQGKAPTAAAGKPSTNGRSGSRRRRRD
ncbi:DEAD/DEAH box helicase [Hymenobacter busanensis]|uniref:DEAD-box ATP-dependent RNA helicase RhpA n=1 Tax=Hymenobacter busanensis TaxID=2607656 RepID=A0A7L4ZSX5_9BACT|nr:DEAD/DEAH box helicase [Hymenobacter busanensis]KAA9327452.1 DEAD/DEAH box helicase [Hymenobacter busanensis]QHJ06211.1 DEAD/DEAH box helicase [Hymenobacter busanensis]